MTTGSISINVKASNDQKYVVSITLSETVLEFKHKVAQNCDTPAERMRLIYSGRVLKDIDTLNTYKIAEGHTVHMVRNAAHAPSTASVTAASAPTTSVAESRATPVYPSVTPGALPNPWANLTSAGGTGGPAMGGFGGIGNMGGMGGMEPAMMSQMMQDPNFAQYMSSMLQNPQVLESMISMNPALRAMGPEARQMLRSPQFQQMISNPDMLRQVAQMNSQFGGMSGMGGLASPGVATGQGGMYNPWASATPASPPTNPLANLWAQQMAGSMTPTQAPTQTQTQQPPEERYRVQLKQLNEMGFWDASKNIRALLAASGNVNSAVELLFSGSV